MQLVRPGHAGEPGFLGIAELPDEHGELAAACRAIRRAPNSISSGSRPSSVGNFSHSTIAETAKASQLANSVGNKSVRFIPASVPYKAARVSWDWAARRSAALLISPDSAKHSDRSRHGNDRVREFCGLAHQRRQLGVQKVTGQRQERA